MLQSFKFLKVLVLSVFVLFLSACGTPMVNQDTRDNQAGSDVVEKNEFVISLFVKNIDEEKSYKGSVERGSNVIDLMQKIQDQGGMKFLKKDSSVGAFVEEINGVPNDIKGNMFWMLYINGESSSVGASSYEIRDGDVIEWRFEDF